MVSIVLVGVAGLASADTLPLEHFFKPALYSNVQLSPDGTHLAAIAPQQEHRNIGSLISELKLDALFAFGTESILTVEEAKTGGVTEAIHFVNKKELTEHLMKFTDSGDLILVKGSRGMAMEDVIEFMKSELN